jgi:hypothetical protein
VDAGEKQMRPAEMASIAYTAIPSNPISYTRKREFHDKAWSAAFAIGFLAFFVLGGVIHAKALPNDVTEFLAAGAVLQKECTCANFPTSTAHAYACPGTRRLDITDEHRRSLQAHEHRRLATAIKSGETIWALLGNMPEVPIGMIAAVISISIGWILALQRPTMTRITVAITLASKIAFLVYLGIQTKGTVQIIFFAFAVIACLVIYQTRAAIELSCKLISESACGLAANPGVVGTCVLAYMPYIAYVALWMTFLSATGRYWVSVPESSSLYPGAPVTGQCTLQLSDTAAWGVRYMMLHFLWVTGMLAQIRLMIVSGTIGTWYFQGTTDVPKYPSFFWLKTALTTSGGSLTVGATISAVVEWIKLKASAKCWCLSPAGLIAKAIICCFAALIMAVTRMCTVVHVFTGESFCAAKDKTMALLKRNFVGGVVTETISKMLFNTAGFLFSVALTCAAWAWYEASDANSYNGCAYHGGSCFIRGMDRKPVLVLTGGEGGAQLYLWLFLALYAVYDPILWVFFIGMFIAPMATGFMSGYPIIIPLCAIFIGCVVNMCFKYMAGVMMDATSAIFVSFAIDRENGTVSNDRESMRKILDSMPCMYQLVPLNGQGAVAGTPVAMGVAVPMVMGAGFDVEMGATRPCTAGCGTQNAASAPFCANCGAKQ